MSEDKDELLKQQNEEIQKLKKELKSATKPSSMLSVLKNSIKRNVHDFFVREDRMKTMDSKIKKLEKELEQKEDELNKTSAELFAAVNLGQSETEPETSPSSDTEKVDDADCRTETAPVFPQTAEEAIKEYFGPINLAELARHYYPDANQVSHSPAEPSATPLKPEPEVEKPKSEDSKESIGISQLEEDKPERRTEQKSEPNTAPSIVAETKKTESVKKEVQKESSNLEIAKEIKKESTKSEPQKPQNSQPVAEKNIKQQPDRQADRATATVVDKNGKKKSKKDKRKGNQNRQMVEESKTQEEMTEKTKTDSQENAQEEKPVSIQKSPEKMKSQADKAPTSKQVTLAEPKEHIVVPIIEPPAEPEVEPPEDFGGVVMFEEPSIDDLPDIGNINSDESSQNVFTDMFNEDWDDSAVV